MLRNGYTWRMKTISQREMRNDSGLVLREVEELLAQFSDVTRAPRTIFEILTNADLKFPEIKDEQGLPIQLSHARYGRLLESPDRRVRRDGDRAALRAAFSPDGRRLVVRSTCAGVRHARSE